MIFERNESGEFVINGTPVNRSVFLAMEPNYSEPEGTIFVHYEQGVGRRIRTKTREYQVTGDWADGNRYISRFAQFQNASASLSLEQQQQDRDIADAKFDSLIPQEKRRLEYPPLEDLVVALWENLIEKKNKKLSGVEAIQKLRKAVKAKYPTGTEDAISTDETEIS